MTQIGLLRAPASEGPQLAGSRVRRNSSCSACEAIDPRKFDLVPCDTNPPHTPAAAHPNKDVAPCTKAPQELNSFHTGPERISRRTRHATSVRICALANRSCANSWRTLMLGAMDEISAYFASLEPPRRASRRREDARAAFVLRPQHEALGTSTQHAIYSPPAETKRVKHRSGRVCITAECRRMPGLIHTGRGR